MGVVGLLIILLWCGNVIGFFLTPDYTENEIEFFTTNGIIFLVFVGVFSIAFLFFVYINSTRIDIMLAGYDAKKRIYVEIAFGTEPSVGYEYQRWQANMDAVKMNEWLEKLKLWYDNWWNIGIYRDVKRRLNKTRLIELKF